MVGVSRSFDCYEFTNCPKGVLNLITRLRFNVIKVGLRKISLSYSRISIAEIASRLKLKSVEDAEYIIAKAINDGNSIGKFMLSSKSLKVSLTR